MTLACEDANTKLVEVVTVADVDDENGVGNSLLQIWKLRFGHKSKLLFRLSAQGLVRSLKLKLRRDFEAEVWSEFCCLCLVWVTKLNLENRFCAIKHLKIGYFCGHESGLPDFGKALDAKQLAQGQLPGYP